MKLVEDLDVFKLAHQLALKTYSTTKTFPRPETFSLVDQMRRAAGVTAIREQSALAGYRLADLLTRVVGH